MTTKKTRRDDPRDLRKLAEGIILLNFRTRLNESIYLFFNIKRGYFAMQVATLPRK
jgi:hypothetical protein